MKFGHGASRPSPGAASAISREDRVSGYINESDDLEQELGVGSGGGGLRKQLEEVLAANKRLTERLEAAERENTVTALLKDKGIDPALAEIIPVDQDPEKWVEAHGALLSGFGKKAGEDDPEELPATRVAADDDPALVAEREAQERMRQAQESGVPAYSQETLDALDKIDNEADLLKFFKENGAPTAG
jgi:hypothetical protein